jgi:hypothetical protein
VLFAHDGDPQETGIALLEVEGLEAVCGCGLLDAGVGPEIEASRSNWESNCSTRST